MRHHLLEGISSGEFGLASLLGGSVQLDIKQLTWTLIDKTIWALYDCSCIALPDKRKLS